MKSENQKTAANGNKMMLGFIVRRCAAEIGHTPTAGEFAQWANGDMKPGRTRCLFGQPISEATAKIMFRQPSRMVTVSPAGLERIFKGLDGAAQR